MTGAEKETQWKVKDLPSTRWVEGNRGNQTWPSPTLERWEEAEKLWIYLSFSNASSQFQHTPKQFGTCSELNDNVYLSEIHCQNVCFLFFPTTTKAYLRAVNKEKRGGNDNFLHSRGKFWFLFPTIKTNLYYSKSMIQIIEWKFFCLAFLIF